MGNTAEKQEPPPPMVLVPPLFQRPHLATRSRMAESSYEVLFNKIARKQLFTDYFDLKDQLVGQIMLQPAEDPRVDITAIVRTSHERPEASGECTFRWQRDSLDPHTFADLTVSSTENALKLRASLFSPETGLGAFASVPFVRRDGDQAEDYGHAGFRFSSETFTAGLTGSPYYLLVQGKLVPTTLWLAGRLGQLTAGLQYKPLVLKDEAFPNNCKNLENWSFALDYGTGRAGPLHPSFNFCLEFCNNNKLLASYYHHLTVQRRVKNPFEADEVVGITNYVDLGFELEHRLDTKSFENLKEKSPLSSANLVASWQANKNIMLKGKLGSVTSGVVLVLKSWWQPSFTFGFAVTRNHFTQKTQYGFGIRMENFGGVSYERADPNYVILTPSKQHIAEGLMRDTGKRPILEKDVLSGNVNAVPPELQSGDRLL